MRQQKGAALRVRAAEAAFELAQEELVNWEEAHEELMNEFRALVDKRELAREKLELAVSDAGIAGGGMRVTSVHTRKFNAEKLCLLVEDDDLRDKLVERVLKVRAKAFDKAVEEGKLDPEIARHCITSIEPSIRITNRPPKITLG